MKGEGRDVMRKGVVTVVGKYERGRGGALAHVKGKGRNPVSVQPSPNDSIVED